MSEQKNQQAMLRHRINNVTTLDQSSLNGEISPMSRHQPEVITMNLTDQCFNIRSAMSRHQFKNIRAKAVVCYVVTLEMA